MFQRSAGGYHAQVARERYAGRGVLELEMPAAPGAHAYTQNFDGKSYFYAEVAVPVRSAPRALPNAVGIIWDSSGSGAARDHGREFALLFDVVGRGTDWFAHRRAGDLVRMVEERAKSNVFLTVLGFGMGMVLALTRKRFGQADQL